MTDESEHDTGPRSQRGVYGISVTAELSGFGIGALRLYEEYGLLTPARTGGGTRRYSDDDLERLKRIAELIDAGVNLVGIGHVLDLEHRTAELERDNRRLKADNAQLRADDGPETPARDSPREGIRAEHTAPGVSRDEQRAPPATLEQNPD